MREFYDGLHRRIFAGSGHLVCRHATEWECEFWLAQLYNGHIVVRVSNVEKAPTDSSRWFARCEPFSLIGKLSDGRDIRAVNFHVTRTMSPSLDHGLRWIYEGFVHLPGFVKIATPGNTQTCFERVTCEMTNLFLGRRPGPIEFVLAQAQIQINRLSQHTANRRLMEALKTAGILSSVRFEFPERTSEDRADDMIRILCGLLTFAQRSPVSCVAQHWQDVNGTTAKSRYQEPVFDYPTTFTPLIQAESLDVFLQSTVEHYTRQWKAWDLGHAIDHYVQSMSLRSVWTQALGFFTSLETLKNAFLQQPEGEGLEYYVPPSEFGKRRIARPVRELLKAEFPVFQTLMADREIRESLTGKINGELNRRAYKLVLKEMFGKLDMVVRNDELQRLVRLRDQIVHRGSPDYERGPWAKSSTASLEAAKYAGLVERTILAILEYQGDFRRYDQVIIPTGD